MTKKFSTVKIVGYINYMYKAGKIDETHRKYLLGLSKKSLTDEKYLEILKCELTTLNGNENNKYLTEVLN